MGSGFCESDDVMKRILWIGIALGLLLSVVGRGGERYLGSVLTAIVALVACAGSGVAVVRSFSASGPSAKAFLQAGGCFLATVAVVWVVVLPLVPFDTWFVGKADPRIRATLEQRAVATADLKEMDPAFLASLDSSLGASRIVGLGESYHWTSEYTTAKTSIIRHLHEHDGFDVLLFESSIAPLFFACEDMVREGEARRGVDGLFKCWQTEEMEELFTYILSTYATERPLRVFGIDRQHFKYNFAGADQLMQEAAILLGGQSDDDDPERGAWVEILKRQRRCDADNPAVVAGTAYYEGLAGAFRQAAGTGGRSPNETLKLTIAGMVAEGLAEDLRGQTLTGRERYIARDRFMAQRVEEFRETVVPDRKLIIWAHNAHLWTRPEEHRLASSDLLGNFEY
ncbi:MAG: erythromycin esterase family protein [Candidatus Krumholzibacteria bacterium]|nr:erythromycin esterase family protein [Candidatus Krumholzibacteria bacterium]